MDHTSSALINTAASLTGLVERSGGPVTCFTQQRQPQSQQMQQELQQQPPPKTLIDSILASLLTQGTLPIDKIRCETAYVDQLISDTPQPQVKRVEKSQRQSRQVEEVCWRDAEDQVMMLALQFRIQKDPEDINTVIGHRIGMLLPNVSRYARFCTCLGYNVLSTSLPCRNTPASLHAKGQLCSRCNFV